MADLEIVYNILEDALKKEKMAEDNCQKILEQLKINGFHDQVEKIKNDEINHQQIIKELMTLL